MHQHKNERASVFGDKSILQVGNDISIIEAENSYEETLKEKHGQAELSVVVQHQAVEVVKAAKALKDAKDQAQQANKDYKQYKRQKDQLEQQLAQLEAELSRSHRSD